MTSSPQHSPDNLAWGYLLVAAGLVFVSLILLNRVATNRHDNDTMFAMVAARCAVVERTLNTDACLRSTQK